MTASKRPARAKTTKARPPVDQNAILQQVGMQLINAIVSLSSMRAGSIEATIADLRQQLSDVQAEAAELAAELNAQQGAAS